MSRQAINSNRSQRSRRSSIRHPRTSRGPRPAFRTQNSRRNSNTMRLPNSGFVGGIDDLKGYYYDCSSYKQADRFVTTSKEINDYVGKNYSNGGDVRHTLENGELMDLPNPTDPSENFIDKVDDDGNIVRTAMEQVAYVDKKVLIVRS